MINYFGDSGMINYFGDSGMTNYFGDSGMMGWCIVIFALVMYWQVIDVFFTQVSSNQDVTTTLQKVEQLLKWVSVAPLLGLLGTVSGLMDSFSAMSQSGSASLSAGVAQALLTTEMGLAIAIPAWVTLLLLQRRFTRIQSTSGAMPSVEGLCADEA